MSDIFPANSTDLFFATVCMVCSLVLLRIEMPVVGFLRRHRMLWWPPMLLPGFVLFCTMVLSASYIILRGIALVWLKLVALQLPNIVYIFFLLLFVRLIGWTVEWKRSSQHAFPPFIHSAGIRFLLLFTLVLAIIFAVFALGLWPILEPVIDAIGQPLVRVLLV